MDLDCASRTDAHNTIFAHRLFVTMDSKTTEDKVIAELKKDAEDSIKKAMAERFHKATGKSPRKFKKLQACHIQNPEKIETKKTGLHRKLEVAKQRARNKQIRGRNAIRIGKDSELKDCTLCITKCISIYNN